jgi:hypothetical protein
MTKKQYALTIVLLIGTFLYTIMGTSRPILDPVNIIVYCLGAAAIVIVIVIVMPQQYCPNCGAKLPRIRIPKNINEKLFGWTTCPICNSEIDNNGRVVKK